MPSRLKTVIYLQSGSCHQKISFLGLKTAYLGGYEMASKLNDLVRFTKTTRDLLF